MKNPDTDAFLWRRQFSCFAPRHRRISARWKIDRTDNLLGPWYFAEFLSPFLDLNLVG